MKKILPVVAFLLILLASCRTSEITADFKPKSEEKNNYYKILVLGLLSDSDRVLQENMENHMAGDLEKLGYKTITSLKEYGPRAFSGMTEAQALAKLNKSEVDAVVTIVLLNKKMEKRFVAASTHQNTSTQHFHMFWDYYGAVSNKIWEPGYYFDNTEYYWESNMYTLGNRSLRYSVQTTSFNPSSTYSLAHQYGKMIVKQMRKRGVAEKDPAPVKRGF
jgi:hypothetical protein